MFAMRLFGVSVAKTGDWARAASVFLEAANVAALHHRALHRMGVGLRADGAFAKWKQRDLPGALRLCTEVLGELDSIPIDRDLRSRYLHATVRHMIVWVWACESERKPPGAMRNPPAGMCSNQDPHEGIADLPRFAISRQCGSCSPRLTTAAIQGSGFVRWRLRVRRGNRSR